MTVKHFFYWKAPAIVWGLTIVVLTSYPKLHIPDMGFSAQDKAAHLAVYLLLFILMARAFMENKYYLMNNALSKAFIFCTLFALADELHQIPIPGRSCELLDFLADLTGIILALIIFKFFVKFKKSKLKSV